MTVVWAGMILLSTFAGFKNHCLDAVSAAALEGAGNAVTVCLTMAGVLCLWSGIMEILKESGLSDKLARLFRPLLWHLLPQASQDRETLSAVSANLSANLLGLGNAATPLGIRAATRMARGCQGIASDELCLLVVLNTASIQLIPTTVAGVRAAAGAAAPFDILPAVWLTSILSVSAGLCAARLFSAFSVPGRISSPHTVRKRRRRA